VDHEESEHWLRQLEGTMRGIPSAVVALSGGVDSALVTAVAARVIPRVLAVTATSAAYAQADLEAARAVCRQIGVPHATVRTRELADPRYAVNQPTRCLHCKTELYTVLAELARQRSYAVILDGTHRGDLGDFRPGLAAAQSLGVRSPLREAGLDKPAIRKVARSLGLTVWDRPASPCLASRFPYGEVLTVEKLAMVEQAEAALRGLGFHELRVRHHGTVARIEVPPHDMAHLLEVASQVVQALRAVGYAYVSLDLSGLRSGSLNEVLSPEVKAGALTPLPDR